MEELCTKSNQTEKRSIAEIESGNGSFNLSSYNFIVFSHLRWDFVYQRPQHIISRLADEYSILFIEEPLGRNGSGDNGYHLNEVSETLHVLKPQVDSIEDIPHLFSTDFSHRTFDVGWFYSPAFSVLLPNFSFNRIVYDCMDELTLFRGASPKLISQEKTLRQNADLLFTGGKALFEAKEQLHNNVHCFPSSVDQDHFRKVFLDLKTPDDIASVNAPIVGYFGVIDERIDMDLIYNTAQSLPDVSFVMIGPLAKIAEDELAKLPNIHYLGMKSYALLPNYLKVFDIAMMPFALNDATKFISPTKTLEYMAAEKPIISTAIKDVVRDYNHCTHIIDSAPAFSDAIRTILEENPHSIKEDYDKILKETSWVSTVRKMNELIKQKIK